MLKTNAIFLVTTAAIAACSSSPAPTGQYQDVNGTGAGGSAAQPAAGTGGVTSSAGSTAIAGTSSTVGGAVASGGSGGAAGAAALAGSGGLGVAGGSSGTGGGSAGTGGGSAGAGGSVPVGNLPNLVPPDYKGTPFGGMAQQIPGKIEVERYDLGGMGVAFNATAGAAFDACGFMRTDAIALECTGQAGPQDQDFATCANYPAGSVYVGYIGTGNWYKYTVDVMQAGTYVISSHAGVSPANTSVSFAFTADTKTAALTLPTTNGKCTSEAYHVWSEAPNIGTLALTPGHYVLTITVVNAGMNLDWFAFTKM
jgi:hypothetical protein